MVTYLYCVLIPSTDPPPGLTGLGGTPVRVLRPPLDRDDGLEAWVGTVDESAFRVSGRALGAQALVHDEVVAAALATGRTPLPARFGSHFSDDEACLTILGDRATQLRGTLARGVGTVEMSLLLVPRRQEAGASTMTLPHRHEPSAGRRYLEILRERERRAESMQGTIETVIEEIRHAVHAIAREESRGRAATGVESIAHLVDREEISRYRDAVHAVPMQDGIRLIVAGPRAPYSFTGSNALVTGHDSGSPYRNV
jgi:hypothetical protein